MMENDPRPGSRDRGAARPGPSAGEVVATRDLHRTFADAEGHEIRVLRGLELSVRRKETLAVVGPSGSGKSTLLHLLGGLDRPTAGRVILGGRPLESLPDEELAAMRNRYVGFVFQFHHLLRDFTALENVMVPQLIAGVGRRRAAARAHELLESVGLADRTDHTPGRLSGGEQQRVAVARALVNEPSLLLADEPSGNLDMETSERLHDMLFELVEEHASALVVVTHNRSLSGRAGRVLKLSGGTLAPGVSDTLL